MNTGEKLLICGIDPGPHSIAWTLWDGDGVRGFGTIENPDLVALPLEGLPPIFMAADCFAIEGIVSYGQRVGEETFQTAETIGILRARLHDRFMVRITRPEIKMHLLGRRAGNDADLKAAIAGEFPAEIGRKGLPEPIKMLKSHNLAAFYVAFVLQRQLAGDFGYGRTLAASVTALKGKLDNP